MIIDLDNCPFCDNKGELKYDGASSWVECNACGARGPLQHNHNGDLTEAKFMAVLSWNQPVSNLAPINIVKH